MWKKFQKSLFLTASMNISQITSRLHLNESGFQPGDSTINQLLYITHITHTAFKEYPSHQTRAVLLDISKAFDKVWHESLIFKLKSNGISGPHPCSDRFLSLKLQTVLGIKW